MNQKLLHSLIDQIKRRRREWIREGTKGGDATRITTEARKRELQEKTLREYAIREGENVETKRTMRELDAVLARIESGKFGICEKCGRSIEEERLSANPTDCNALLCMRGESRITAWVSERKGVRGTISRLYGAKRTKETFCPDFFEFRARRDKASLDIFWLRAESFEGSDNVLFKKSW